MGDQPRNDLAAIQRRKLALYGWMLMAPSLALLSLFAFYPAIATFFGSLFTRGTTRRPSSFAGFENYLDLFADPTFWTVAGNNLIYAGVTIPVSIIFALIMALWANAHIPARSFGSCALATVSGTFGDGGVMAGTSGVIGSGGSTPMGGFVPIGSSGVIPVGGKVPIGGVTPIGRSGVIGSGGSTPIGGFVPIGSSGVIPVGGKVPMGGVTPIGSSGVIRSGGRMPIGGLTAIGTSGVMPVGGRIPIGGITAMGISGVIVWGGKIPIGGLIATGGSTTTGTSGVRKSGNNRPMGGRFTPPFWFWLSSKQPPPLLS